MVTFLDNLPSFDKENFSNFHPDLNQCVTPKKQSFIVCSRENSDSDEQLIVNQKCNIIIQYLNDQNNVNYIIDANNDGATFTQQINSLNTHKAKKRDIRDVLDLNNDQKQMSTSQTCTSPVDRQVNDNHASTSSSSPSSPTSSSSKYLKKRKLTAEDEVPTTSSNTTATTSTQPTTSSELMSLAGSSSSHLVVNTPTSTSYDELIEIDDASANPQSSGFMN